MDQPSQCKITPDKLPKSVKVRSTCNACQQAKIRCSHERPSCRRCQKHKIDCIYSISRRLGRPAKKKDNPPEKPSTSQDSGEHSSNQSNKRVRSLKKRKVKEEASNDIGAKERQKDPTDTFPFDGLSFEHNLMDSIFPGDANPQTTTFMDIATTSPFPESLELTSDNWLQEFMSNPFTDWTHDRSGPDPLETGSDESGDINVSMPVDLKDLPAPSEVFDQSSSLSYYPAVDNGLTQVESALGGSQGIAEGNSPYTEYIRKQNISWPQPLSALVEELPVESSSLFSQTMAPKRACEYNVPVDDLRATSGTVLTSNSQCQSHEQAVRDLIRVNICASRTSPSIAIDSILTCQRVLQQLAETILQCRTCSRTRVNLLMVVIVSIDSLVTTLDTITSLENDVVDRLLPDHSNAFLQDYRLETVLPTHHSRRYKGNNAQFRSQLDTCPLIIGDFYVPSEEKLSFVKRVLHTRLSGLLSTIEYDDGDGSEVTVDDDEDENVD